MSEEQTATKIVPDLGIELISYVRAKLKEKLLKKPKPVWKFRGADVHVFGDSETGYVVLWANNEVQYFVRFRRIRHNGFRLGRQVLLWRNQDNEFTRGFAQKVFFDFLLPKYGALVADKEQTRNGAAFWGNAVQGAFARGLYVYCLDRRSRQTKLDLIQDDADLDQYHHTLWGNTPAHLLTFAVISQRPLVLTKRV